MSNLKIELSQAGVRELLRSQEMQQVCTEVAGQRARAMGSGYKVSAYRGRNRVNASIYTEDPKLIQENKRSNTILKGLFGR